MLYIYYIYIYILFFFWGGGAGGYLLINCSQTGEKKKTRQTKRTQAVKKDKNSHGVGVAFDVFKRCCLEGAPHLMTWFQR